MGFRTKEMAERIGKSMWNFIKWDKCNESVMGKSFRIRVRVDITPTKKGNYSKIWRKDDKKDFVQILEIGKSLFLVQMLGSFDEGVTVRKRYE